MNQTKTIDFDFDPKKFDYDSLVDAAVAPTNKKQIIIDHLNANGIPAAGPDLQLFQKNGIVIKDDFASYLGNSEYYSTGSFAKLANGTPLDFEYDTTDGLKAEIEKYKDKSHFDLGTFVHEAILEPEKWENVVCEPKANRASHEGLDRLIEFWSLYVPVPAGMPLVKTDDKKQAIAQMVDASGKRAIDFKDALIVQRLHARWMEYQKGLWAGILKSAHKEVSMYTNDFFGLPQRVRPDGILFADQIGVNAIVSVKTTSATSVGQYARQFVQLGYNIKEAAYQKVVSHVTGVNFDTTIMIVLSTAEPFQVGVFILADQDIRDAGLRYEAAVLNAQTCLQLGKFPGWEINAGIDDLGIIDLTING
jgi:hypothetical protein